MPVRCEICGEVVDCTRAHVGTGPKVGSAEMDCPLKLGAIWLYVKDDDGKGVPGIDNKVAGKGGTTDTIGFSPFDPLDEGQHKASIGPLTETQQEKYLLPELIEALPAVQRGKITLVEFVLDRIAPLKVTVKRSDKEEFVKDISVHLVPPSPEKKPAKDQENTPETGIVTFPRLRKGDYSVKLVLTPEQQKKYKVEEADTKPWSLDPAKENAVEFKLTPIIRIYLKLQFLDPEGASRPFPKDLELVMKFEAGIDPKDKKVTVGDDGIVGADDKPYVEVPRTVKSFTLDLAQAEASFVVCEKRGEAKKTQELVAEADPTAGDLLDKLKAEGRAFRLPIGEWTLKNSSWDVVETELKTAKLEKPDFKFSDLEPLPAEVGAEGKPVELTLKPAWQFIRFTYYDRKLKGDAPISVPPKPNADVLPLLLQGWRKTADESAAKVPDTHCIWPLGAKDEDSILCLPWIIGSDNTNVEAKIKPDEKTILAFKRKETNPFIHTTSATDRKLIDFTDADLRDKPGLTRLDYYDLPTVWKSRKYFGWLSDADCGPYEDVAVKDTAIDKPLIFCLDDIVLTSDTLAPLPLTPGTRVALLSHTFAKSSGAAPASTGPSAEPGANKPQKPSLPGKRLLDYQGLYNPDTAAKKSYFSKVAIKINYIADYPHWTRLVACNGNLFDVFDKRLPDDAGNSKVVGARAGVRWVDNVSGKPSGSVAARPDRTDKAFYSVQGLYEQEYAQRFASTPYDHGAPSTCQLGRFDYALARCCDVRAGKEVAVNLVYFRMNFNVTAVGVDSAQYGEEFVTNVAKRWNGADSTAPAKRVEFLPQEPAGPALLVEHVWFGQSLAAAQSHFKSDVPQPPPDGSRSWFNGAEGKGELAPGGKGDEDPGGSGLLWFVGAHECGHGVGLNDDYCERWSAYSYGQLSYRWHLPGDPYEPDGRTDQFHEAGAAMMNGNQQMRNRYFWPMAEWVRDIIKAPLKVKLDTYDAYKLPPHPTAPRTYPYWPIAAATDWEPDAAKNRGKLTSLLYALGAEYYTAVTLPGLVGSGAAMDGLLVVTVNMEFEMPDWGDDASNASNRELVASTMATIIRDNTAGLNGRFVAQGTVNGGTPQEWVYQRCLLHFSPRFLVKNDHTDPGEAANLAAAMGSQFEIAVVDDPMPNAPTMKTLSDFQSATEAGGGTRAVADAELSDLDTLVGDYEALEGTKKQKRLNLLTKIIDKCKSYEGQGPGSISQLFNPDPTTIPASFDNRVGGVTALKVAAKASKTFYEGLDADFADEELRLKFRWEKPTAMPEELMGVKEFKRETGADPGPRAPADTYLDDIETALTEYYAIKAAKTADRVKGLEKIVKACDDFSSHGGALSIGSLFSADPVDVGKHEKWAAAATTLRTQADAMSTYLKAVVTSHKLRLFVKSMSDLGDLFAGQFATFLGLEKPCEEVTAGDLEALTRQVIPGATVADA